MNNDVEIKEWVAKSNKWKIAMLLIEEKVAFSYDGEVLVFSAPENYILRLVRRLMGSYGVSKRPMITEMKN